MTKYDISLYGVYEKGFSSRAISKGVSSKVVQEIETNWLMDSKTNTEHYVRLAPIIVVYKHKDGLEADMCVETVFKVITPIDIHQMPDDFVDEIVKMFQIAMGHLRALYIERTKNTPFQGTMVFYESLDAIKKRITTDINLRDRNN